jgi:hypothetical protein
MYNTTTKPIQPTTKKIGLCEKQRQYIQEHESLSGFYHHFQYRMHNSVLACRVITSGLVDRADDDIDVITELGSLALKALPIPGELGGNAWQSLIDLGAYGTHMLHDTIERRRLHRMGSLVNSLSHMENIIEETARLLTLRYHLQIKQLSCSSRRTGVFNKAMNKLDLADSQALGGAEELAESAVKRIFNFVINGGLEESDIWHLESSLDDTMDMKILPHRFMEVVFLSTGKLWSIPRIVNRVKWSGQNMNKRGEEQSKENKEDHTAKKPHHEKIPSQTIAKIIMKELENLPPDVQVLKPSLLKSLRWSDNGIFGKTGIVTPEGRLYRNQKQDDGTLDNAITQRIMAVSKSIKNKNNKKSLNNNFLSLPPMNLCDYVEKYGYRSGTQEEAIRYGLVEVAQSHEEIRRTQKQYYSLCDESAHESILYDYEKQSFTGPTKQELIEQELQWLRLQVISLYESLTSMQTTAPNPIRVPSLNTKDLQSEHTHSHPSSARKSKRGSGMNSARRNHNVHHGTLHTGKSMEKINREETQKQVTCSYPQVVEEKQQDKLTNSQAVEEKQQDEQNNLLHESQGRMEELINKITMEVPPVRQKTQMYKVKTSVTPITPRTFIKSLPVYAKQQTGKQQKAHQPADRQTKSTGQGKEQAAQTKANPSNKKLNYSVFLSRK